MLPKIAKALDVSIEWLLQGPDFDDPKDIPRFLNANKITLEINSSNIDSLRSKANTLILLLNENGLHHAIALLEGLSQNHATSKHNNGASVPLPAPTKIAA